MWDVSMNRVKKNELIFMRPLSDLPTTDMPSSFLTYEKNNNKKALIIYKKWKLHICNQRKLYIRAASFLLLVLSVFQCSS